MFNTNALMDKKERQQYYAEKAYDAFNELLYNKIKKILSESENTHSAIQAIHYLNELEVVSFDFTDHIMKSERSTVKTYVAYYNLLLNQVDDIDIDHIASDVITQISKDEFNHDLIVNYVRGNSHE